MDRLIRIAAWLAFALMIVTAYMAQERARKAEKYSEHLARELRLCEEGKR